MDDDHPPDADGHAGLSVAVILESDRTPAGAGEIDTDRLAATLAHLAALAGAPGGAVTVAIVDDARMRELHERYHGDPSTTDVLSFDMRDAPGDAMAGDLVLCLDEARRQAADRGHDVATELLLYGLHGLLHLMGHDDREPDDARRMHQLEDELLTRAGIGKVYDRPRANDPGADANERQ